MGATPEALVKKKVKEVLKEFGAYYVMPVTGGYGNSGAPDFIACLHGKFVGIECKAGKNRTTALQEHNLDSIRVAGGVGLVVNDENVVELKSILVNLVKGESHETQASR
jgi:Holliday junction resolvase